MCLLLATEYTKEDNSSQQGCLDYLCSNLVKNFCPSWNRSRGKGEDIRGYEHVSKNTEGFPDNLAVADVILLCPKSECLRQEAEAKRMLTYSPETLNYK